MALGLQQHNPLLQVPLASLQAMQTVNQSVKGVGTVLPLFHAHSSQPTPASGLPPHPPGVSVTSALVLGR